jgi:glycosyltransferase involved in cell wall biosynthesis
MRITIVTGAFLPLPPAACGAIEIRWQGVAEELAARGHQVTFLSRSWRGLKSEETINGVHHIRRSGFRRTNFLSINLLKGFLYSLRMFFKVPRGDVCINNTIWLPILLSLLRPGAGKILFNVARYPKGQMWMYGHVHRLVCPSNAVAAAVTTQTPALARITQVIPNPINIAVFVPPRRPRRFDGRRYAVFTGRVHPEKGLHVLIDAFRAIPDRPADLGLRIVGPTESSRGGGGRAYLRTLMEKAKGLPVEFIPPIFDRVALAGILQDSHYYCYPSLAERGESFGVAPLEAMATGLAPIVSDLPCFRDFIEDGINGVVFDHRHDAVQNLSQAMSKMIHYPGLAAEMGLAAARVAQQYSYSAVADQLLADLQGLVENAHEAVLGGPI